VKHLVKILAFGALVSGTPVYARGAHPIGATVSAHWSMPLRQSPPGGFFRGLAPQVGATKPSQHYTVEDSKTVPNLTGDESWVKLKAVSGEEAGWSYDGQSNDKSGNLEEVK
jgi:hypothetical protein